MLCDSASPYLRDNFDLLFAFQQIVNNLVEADFLKVLNMKLHFFDSFKEMTIELNYYEHNLLDLLCHQASWGLCMPPVLLV